MSDGDWLRLDPRMLLVLPVRELGRFVIPLVAFVVAGSTSGSWWQYLAVVVPVALGLLRYLTTSYRVGTGRIELRRGLLTRRVLSTPLDRVRTVDLTSSPLQRVLGLASVRVGTGGHQQDDDSLLELPGLPVARARALRASLVETGPAGREEVPGMADVPGDEPTGSVRPLVEFDPRWLRFAPLTGTGLVVVAAGLGALSQLDDVLGLGRRLREADLAVPTTLGVLGLATAALVVLGLVSVAGYLVVNAGFRLTHQAGAWQVRRGLLTTRETTLAEERVAGVALGESLALRLAGGRDLQAVVTGLASQGSGETGATRGGATIVPAADAAVVLRVAAAVLGDDTPLTAPLIRHGRSATRRRWVRALGPALALLTAAVVAVVAGAPAWLLPVAPIVVAGAVVLAADRTRGLGHALVASRLVARSGSLTRRREVLDLDHVIGWTWRTSWSQRRAGLCTLVATTAGGRGAVRVPDVPEQVAVALATAATPALLAPFLRPPDPPEGMRRTSRRLLGDH